MKKIIKKNLQYYWALYLVAIVLPIFVWISVFDAIAKPKANEQISILYVGSYFDTEQLHSNVLEFSTQDIDNQEIKKINIESYDASFDYIYTIMETRLISSDFFIITESALTQFGDNLVPSYFKGINNEVLQIDESLFYYREETPYGIILYDGINENRFSKYTNLDEVVYLFFCPSSVNLANMYGEGNITDDAAIQVVKYLMEEVN